MNETQSASPGTDPFEPMREAFEEALESWSRTVQQSVGGGDLAAASGHLLTGYVAMQESLRATSQLTADALHLPSKDDLARIAELVINVERKVDEVADQVHALVALAERPRPDGLASVDDRLGAIEAKLGALTARPEPPASLDDRLGAIEAKLDALGSRPEPPASLDDRLGAIEAKLDALGSRPEPPAAAKEPSKPRPAPRKRRSTPPKEG